MTILFVLRHAAFIRNFEGVIAALLSRGHTVTVAFSPIRKEMDEATVQAFLDRHPELDRLDPPPRTHPRQRLSDAARALRDHLRYGAPFFRGARALWARSLRKMHPALLHRVIRWRLLTTPLARWLVGFLSRRVDAGLGPDPALVDYLRALRPDVLAVTPLVDFSYGQMDLVKAARWLGIPVAYPVASWDNLSSKGLIQQRPDRIIVWNETQRAEVRTLHRMPASSVRVVGAPLFDMWFEAAPALDRAAYCAALGFDPDRPILLYLASSPFICPEEAPFALEWVAAVRGSGLPSLSGANILIRPHPNNLEQWRDVALPASAAPTVIRPLDTALPITPDARKDYLTALSHCDGAIGINTTAFIEAAILGHPCFTVLDPRFRHSQRQAPHFTYIERDLLYVASTLAAHIGQLGQVIKVGQADGRAAAFVRRFVRPCGADTAATPLMADAIEETAELPSRCWRPSLPSRAGARLLLGSLRDLDEHLALEPADYMARHKDRALKDLMGEIKAIKQG